MSRKTLKALWDAMPNKTPEQVEAFYKFYENQPQDAFKSFNSKEEFEQYVNEVVGKKTSVLQSKVNEYEVKPKLENAQKAFQEAGFKPSMFKYVADQAYISSDEGVKSFNDKAQKPEFWKGIVDKLEDKENYTTDSVSFPPINSGIKTQTASQGHQPKPETKQIHF